MDRRGRFITLEGIDGCGKSTQAEYLANALKEQGVEVVLSREPGGTPISEKIRNIILDVANENMSPECELLLFEASRAQHVRELIEPALERGAWVVCDRFYDSTAAYQQAARGLDSHVVDRANELGACACVPDITFVFDLEPKLAAARRASMADDRMEAEGLEFQARVREGYLALAAREPERIHVIDASPAPAEIFDLVWTSLQGENLL